MFRQPRFTRIRLATALLILTAPASCGEAYKERAPTPLAAAEDEAVAETEAATQGRPRFDRERPIDLGAKRERRPAGAFYPTPLVSGPPPESS
jgi:hypothetical protein